MAVARFTIVNIGFLSMNKYWGETERVREGTATCTLIESGGLRLIVDPSPYPDVLRERLFATTSLRPEAIDLVFVTHWHGDHRYGLELFPGKPRLASAEGLADWRARAPQDVPVIESFQPAEGRLPEGITLLPTPGHTPGHCALRFDSEWGTVVVAGDAVMTREFFGNEEGFHNSWGPSRAAETIRMLRAEADYIVPGHGNFFPTMRGKK
jgi:glyoxylase-like metal-dependent hydrolase (beta-lactamase superfamily II)